MKPQRMTAAAICLACAIGGNASAQSAEETCDGVEDFALSIIRAKSTGVTESEIRSSVDIPGDTILDTLVDLAYSDDRIDEEYMLKMARVKCSAALMLSEKDIPEGEDTSEDLDPDLPRYEWMSECARRDWVADNEKLSSREELNARWRGREDEVRGLAEYMWERREAANNLEISGRDIFEAQQAGELTEFQTDAATSMMFCAVDRMVSEEDE